MAKVSITEAAKLANISRNTFYKHVKAGKVTVERNQEGDPLVDTSELLRVYGPIQAADSSPEQKVTHEKDNQNSTLQQVVDAQREHILALKDQLQAAGGREVWLQKQVDEGLAARQIEDKRPKRRWWSW